MSVISVNDITKIYRLYNSPMDRFKEAVSPFHKKYSEPFYALKNVSFSVEQGETVGIIGTNGSGKSTILKIITGVIKPTEGNVEVNGKVSALLELGAGFDPDYSGIENIYMNGAVMGFTREEMEAKKDDILSFADIGDFVYQPVKTYSSGMLVRLAFALAINVDPEILIIDEALAVGDAFFQAKCFNRLEEIKKAGTTILFVSHDIISVKKLCSRAIWIERGIIQSVGEAGEVCEKYMSAQIERNNVENEKIVSLMASEIDSEILEVDSGIKRFSRIDIQKAEAVTTSGKARILSFYVRDEDGNETLYLKTEHKYTFGIVGSFTEHLEHVIFGFELENIKGVRIFGINNFMQNKPIGKVNPDKIYEVTFSFVLPRFCKGEYLVTPAISAGTQDNHVVHIRIHNFQTLMVESSGFNVALLELDGETEILEYKKENVVIS